MNKLNDEESFIYKMADCRLYGIYCDVEQSPIDPDYCDSNMKCRYDDSDTNDPDQVYEWIKDYHEDNEIIIDRISEFEKLSNYNDKWNMIRDWSDDEDIMFSDLSFYYYVMTQKLIGVSFTLKTAREIKDSIPKELNPHIDILSRHELRGYGELNEVANFLRDKAKEIFCE